MSDKKSNEINDNEISEVNGGITNPFQESTDNNLHCPRCGSNFHISLSELLTTNAVFCPYCGFRIDLPKGK